MLHACIRPRGPGPRPFSLLIWVHGSQHEAPVLAPGSSQESQQPLAPVSPMQSHASSCPISTLQQMWKATPEALQRFGCIGPRAAPLSLQGHAHFCVHLCSLPIIAWHSNRPWPHSQVKVFGIVIAWQSGQGGGAELVCVPVPMPMPRTSISHLPLPPSSLCSGKSPRAMFTYKGDHAASVGPGEGRKANTTENTGAPFQ